MNAKLDLVLEHVAAAGVDLRATGEDRWRGDCVACGGHDRMTVGLDLNEDVFLKCWSATCRSQDILDALGLSWDDLKARSDLEVGGADPAAALRAARVNLIERIREGIPELEYVAGMAGAFVRGKRHHVAGELKSGKSLSIGIVASVDIVAAGGIVVVLDRENGAEEYARRLARVLDARKAGDRLRDRLAENFRYYAWPAVRLEWGQDPGYPEAIAGADLVVFDSARRFLTVTDMTEDSSDDFARFSESLVDPLMRAGIATCILDNVGHSAKDRARGSSSKGDLADLVFVLKTTEPFNLDTRSRLELRCTASRFGEIHGTWELELGGGGYGHWCELEHPQRREEFLKACLTVLQERSPLGRDSLIKAAREHGAWGRNEVLRNWLAEFVGEELLAHNQGGFCPLAPRRGHSGATPRPGPAPLAPAPLREGAGGQGGPDPGPGPRNGVCPSKAPDRANVVYLDSETSGLDPRADQLVLVGFAADDGEVVVLHHGSPSGAQPQRGLGPAPTSDREEIQAWLDLDATFCGHNIGFDLHFLENAGYRIPDPSRWVDTVLIAHITGERKPGQTALRRLQPKLIEAAKLPADALEPERALNAWLRSARRAAHKAGSRRPEKGEAPLALLGPYLQADVAATRAVAQHYGASINGQAPVLDLERRCLPALYATERRGVPLDLDAARELRDRTEANVADLRARSFELAGHSFNLNAARQIEQVLLERGADLGAVPRTPRADMPMFTAETLALVDDEFARVLLEYREEKKMSDYVAGLWRHAHGDRLYGTFRQLGTETGRMSSGSPNLQNIPKSDLRVRYVICAGEGKVLVGADLDSVELRVLAAYAPGGTLERAFADGVDLHQQTADACGVDRDQGKRLNYLTIYGGGAPLVARILGCSTAEAKAVLDRWYRLYPEVGQLKRKLARRVERHGYLTTVSGRRHHFEQPNHLLLNRLISGSCADMFKATAIELHEHGVPVVLYVHDEVVAEVNHSEAEETAKRLETALARGASGIRDLKAEATVARRWSDFKQPGYAP